MEKIDRVRRSLINPWHAHRQRTHLISSAIVNAFPHRAAEVAERIEALGGTEICAVSGGKIVVLIEADEPGAIGSKLTRIALMDGVLAANLVYEHADVAADGEQDGAEPA
jgi:nitrate reductase NapD